MRSFRLLVSSAFFLVVSLANAQIGFPGGSTSTTSSPPCWPPPCSTIPVDGGIAFLIAGGAAYGALKLRSAKKST